MHPLLRNSIIGAVGLIIAGGLVTLALIGRDSELSVIAMLVAGILGTIIGVFLYSQGWLWGSRAARDRDYGQSFAMAAGGGLMGILAAVALALLIILVLLFYLG